MPRTIAVRGCRMKRKRPGPVRRRGMSSRNARENRYISPRSSASRTVPGTDSTSTTSVIPASTSVERRSVMAGSQHREVVAHDEAVLGHRILRTLVLLDVPVAGAQPQAGQPFPRRPPLDVEVDLV